MHNLAELFRWRACIMPDVPALWFEGRTTTYRELDCRANQVANALIARGVKPGERICVLDQNHDWQIELMAGVAKAGAVFVPINWRLAPPEVAYVVNDAQAQLLFVGGPFGQTVQQIQADLTSVRQVVAFSGGSRTWETYAAMRDAAPPDDPRVPMAAEDTAWLLYTSGTTGNPKGAELTTANLMCVQSWAAPFGLLEEQRALAAMPFYHIGGCGYALTALTAGLTLVIARQFEPAQVLALIEAQKVNHAFLVPATLLFLLQAAQKVEIDRSSLVGIAYGASPIPEDLLRRAIAYFGCEFFQVYGLTETTGVVTRLRWQDHHLDGAYASRLKSVGQPIFGMDVRVVDAHGQDVPSGEVGEIVIRGPQNLKGYWNNPQATASALRDGWFHSGDAGYFDRDGFLYVYDRIKDMVISGGENIYPAEVENCLAAHPAVADVGVIGVPDDEWGEAVKAVIVLKPDASASEQELIEFCKGRIANYKRPKSVDFATALPRNPTGKILKRELRKPYWAGRERAVH